MISSGSYASFENLFQAVKNSAVLAKQWKRMQQPSQSDTNRKSIRYVCYIILFGKHDIIRLGDLKWIVVWLLMQQLAAPAAVEGV